jgi:hypothetical protein
LWRYIAVTQENDVVRITSGSHRSPIQLFRVLNTRCKGLLEEARKEVYKNALKRLPAHIRHSRVGDTIIAFNVGSYLMTPSALNVLYRIIKEYDDAYRRVSGEPLLSCNEVWDEAGPFVFTFMRGFLDKHNLNPTVPDDAFVSLL